MAGQSEPDEITQLYLQQEVGIICSMLKSLDPSQISAGARRLVSLCSAIRAVDTKELKASGALGAAEEILKACMLRNYGREADALLSLQSAFDRAARSKEPE